MLFIAKIIFTIIALPALLSCAYLLLLTLLSARLPMPPRSKRSLRFAVVVPAHNEELGIGATVQSLRRLDWDSQLLRIVVVADNCNDRTAEIAQAAGASVLVRQNADLRGKGYALAHAFEALLAEDWADAIVIVDADAEVSENLLEAFAARIDQGESAVQAHYGIRNPMASWRTRLISVAKGAFHIVRSRARERLQVSCGIRGNGWCVTKALLQKVPYRCFSLTEDLEYGITLGRAGVRVAYADEAHSNADMVTSSAIAGRQRQRWEAGRMAMIRQSSVSLLLSGLRSRSAIQLDLAFDLLVLPLSYVVINILLLMVGGFALSSLDPDLRLWAWTGVACLLALLLHVLRGWQLSGTGIRGLTALLHVPFFLIWKLIVMLGRKSGEWVRTERETQ